jgi:subtilisin-like proprotein convertase family protein
MLVFGLALSGTAAAAEFAGSNLGSIPDNDPNGRDVTFSVGGLTAPLADVTISMTLAHTYVRDLEATLIAPGGVSRRVIFARTGVNSNGGGNGLGATYTFSDRVTGDWWVTVGAASGVIPAGNYRSSTAGFFNSSIKTGGCNSPLTFAFNGLSTAQVNGTWTLHVADLQAADTGAISAAKLTLMGANDQIYFNGFEGMNPGSCVHAQFDYTGSNRSSYVVVRNTGGGPGGAITWLIRDNDGTPNGFERSYTVGVATDLFIGGDFDGDGVWDPAIWHPATPGHYTVRPSSRPTGVPLIELDYGQIGDDAKQAGDYDGDGKADFALYRAGAMSGDPSFMVIRLSGDGADRILPSGLNGYFASGGSDIDGDGFADVAMQSNAGGGAAKFDIHTGTTGAIVDTYNFGMPTDVIITGNHTGNARADTTVIRASGADLAWNTRDSATGVAQPQVLFGNSATDFGLSSDFDGDGYDDYAVWRPNLNPALTIFSVRPSSSPGNPFDVNFGQNGDYPVANSRAH